MAPKINKSNPHYKDQAIKAAKEAASKNASELIIMSFKYLTDENQKFKCFEQEHSYYIDLLKRFKSLSSVKVLEMHTNRSSALRMHPIKWSDTSEKSFSIPGEDQIVETPYQIALSANEGGRLHGFFINNTFYIVWFDKDHLLYPGN